METTFYRFWGGFAHIPLYLLLTKGDTFQRLVVITFVMVSIGFQLAMASAISGVFMIPESNEFWLLMFILVATMLAIYALTMFLYSKKVFSKLLFNGNWREWLLYSIGAVFTYASMHMIISITFGFYRITLLLFAFWSFFILCFAIINTNEKAKQRFAGEMAHNIISSGREYYLRMNELQQTLQIQRHDYKYHLLMLNQMLISDNKESAASYLSNLEQQFAKNEVPRFCTNTVINALLVSYAERIAKIGIKFNAEVALHDSMTIPDYDMCIILGNLLENAINISEKFNNECTIELSLGSKGEQLSIVAENIFIKSIPSNDRIKILVTNDDELVIKSISTVTTRYNGEFDTIWSDTGYTVYVLLCAD